jgi:hypothetical protein
LFIIDISNAYRKDKMVLLLVVPGEENFPALWIDAGLPGLYYHTSMDLASTLNPEYIANVTKFVAGNMAELAQIRVPVNIIYAGLNFNYM